MHRLLLKGIPIAESELYKRRERLSTLNVMLGLHGKVKAKAKARASTLSHIRTRNVDYKQSGIQDARERENCAPVYSTASVGHQATRKRFLSIYKSGMAQENTDTQLA